MNRKMTRDGYDRIQAEINRLWTEERPMVVEECYEAAQLGDRSENAAYIYGKRRLRQIDGRLQFLRRKVKDVTIVDTRTLKAREDIQFGALVTIEDEEGVQTTFRLVDSDEADPKLGSVSVQSPVEKSSHSC